MKLKDPHNHTPDPDCIETGERELYYILVSEDEERMLKVIGCQDSITWYFCNVNGETELYAYPMRSNGHMIDVIQVLAELMDDETCKFEEALENVREVLEDEHVK